MCNQLSDSAVTLKIIKRIGRKIIKETIIDKMFQTLFSDRNSFFKYLKALFKILGCLIYSHPAKSNIFTASAFFLPSIDRSILSALNLPHFRWIFDLELL